MSEQVNNDQVNKDNDKYISISEAEQLTGIPNATLKRYMLNHSEYIQFRKKGREYRLKITELDKLKLIRKLYNEGLKREDVNERLEAEGIPVTITLDEYENKSLISVNEEIAELKKLLNMQMQFNQHLLKEVQELKQIVNRKEAEMIQELRNSMQEVKQETLKALEEASASKEKGWFSRLFKR
jgi:hypothetical protein